MKRREFMKITGLGGASLVIGSGAGISCSGNSVSAVTVNPGPLFELSPWLYMQFMEPLGATECAVDAAWNYAEDCWREDVIQITRKLSPTMIRWGGIISAYYRWKEGVGPRDKRKPMLNTFWFGMESNQVGTAEFVDFCNQVGADPLMCVNFESEGRTDLNIAVTKKGEVRSAGAMEAAEWIDYCNNPSNKRRISHGFKNPLTINVWQIGNETSYVNGFDNVTAAKKTVEFAKAMKNVDPSIKIIGWGDSGWAKQMMDIAGEYLDYIAFHHHFDPGRKGDDPSILRDNEYRKDPDATWEVLMNGYAIREKKLAEMRNDMGSSPLKLALTESHYSLAGRNRCEVLSSWAAGVSYARLLNTHERHGDMLKIATLADFCGTRWMTNAIIIQFPEGRNYLMPVGKVMSLYRHHVGKEFLETSSTHSDLDVTASRTGNTIYLHVVNTSRTNPVKTILRVTGCEIQSAKAFELSTDPTFEIMNPKNDPLIPKEKTLDVHEPVLFPPASVTAVELVTGQ